MASVLGSQVEAIQKDPRQLLRPSIVTGVSHALCRWGNLQTLKSVLAQTVDGGEVLHSTFWHPLRPPLFHRSDAVREIATRLEATWKDTAAKHPELVDEWLDVEVHRALRALQHAARAGEYVVTALEPPVDAARAKKVVMPWLGSSVS